MTFDPMTYEMSYWTARSGAAGHFISASARVGYQHGAVDLALDRPEVQGELRERLRALSRAHVVWSRAVRLGDRAGQVSAGAEAERVMRDLAGEESLKTISPSLWDRVRLAPGINLVF